MLKEITGWLLKQGVFFATCLINLTSAIITMLAYLVIAIIIAWWDRTS
jgi:hypothetical protein